MNRLVGAVRSYDWGSKTMLASLRGEAETEQPEAEIWYGAHPGGTSRLDSGSTLLELIEADPERHIGEQNVSTHGQRLPFLLKLLAASEPLSIQVHPTLEQARRGCAREDAAGIARHAPNRSFRDDNHKPELIVALTRFEALVGFREPEETIEFLRAIEALGSFVTLIADEGPKAGVEAVLGARSETGLLETASIVSSIVDGARAYDGGRWKSEAQVVCRLSEIHPGDPGIAVACLLNRIELQAGQGLFLDAGHLHSYVHGLAVEVMANSDNVVRGGLTVKHLDVPTLLDIVRPDPFQPALVPVNRGRYESPAPEFSLSRVDAEGERRILGPAIAVGVEGRTTARNDESIDLAPTEAVWVPAGEAAVIESTGMAFVAEVGS